MTTPRQARRRYDASSRQLQARQNRDRILVAARRLFVERGYAATSIEQIAAEAGVSGRTVFAGFASKVNLLKQVLDTVISGDGLLDAGQDRGRQSGETPPAMRQVHEAATAEEAYERLADAFAEVAERAYGIYAVVHGAAGSDPEIGELERQLEERRLTAAGQLAAAFADRLGVTDPAAVAGMRDTLWALGSPLQYRLLVRQRGWPVRRYRDWAARALAAMVPPA